MDGLIHINQGAVKRFYGNSKAEALRNFKNEYPTKGFVLYIYDTFDDKLFFTKKTFG